MVENLLKFSLALIGFGVFIDFIFVFAIIPAINQVVILSQFGFSLKANALAYKNYVEKVEKPKLNFENSLNNPKIQHYLPHLAYAVAFGYILDYSNLFDSLVKNKKL